MAVSDGTSENARGTMRTKGKHAKRGTYTITDASNAFPVDAEGNRIYYQYQEYPRTMCRVLENGEFDHDKSVKNDFELNQALAEGWSKTPQDALDAAAGSAVAPPADAVEDAPAPKRGPKAKVA